MSENPALEAHEHREHAEHAAHAHNPFVTRVSMTIAALAVVTALTGSFEITEEGGAITAASRAVLSQDRATDAWNFYQAKSLKKHLYDLAADQNGPHAADYRAQSKANGADQAKSQEEAKTQEEARDKALEQSERHERRHHRLTGAALLLQIGIAIATIAIITGKRPFWWGSIGLGVVGALTTASSFLL